MSDVFSPCLPSTTIKYFQISVRYLTISKFLSYIQEFPCSYLILKSFQVSVSWSISFSKSFQILKFIQVFVLYTIIFKSNSHIQISKGFCPMFLTHTQIFQNLCQIFSFGQISQNLNIYVWYPSISRFLCYVL